MKFGIRSVILSAVLTCAAIAGCAPSHSFSVDRKSVGGLPMVTAKESATSSVTVEAIDYVSRTIALSGAEGKTTIFEMASSVQNFNKIKKGDTVKVEYNTVVVATVRKTNELPEVNLQEGIDRAKLGEKPGMTCWRKAEIQTTVKAVDYNTRELQLKEVGGDVYSITADAKVPDFDKIHVGDQVVFNYTESLTIKVD